MTLFQVFILAFLQGITEFIPVSSSGHLVIFQKFFELQPPVLFDILVHVGTLVAILIYFRKCLPKISWRTLRLVFVGTIPVAVTGFLLQLRLEEIFDSLRLVGFALLVTAGLLFSTRLAKNPRKSLARFTPADALIIGLFQALAILPGISRSGATITAGLHRRAQRQASFRFSFFLAIPAIFGALALQIPALTAASTSYLGQGIFGLIIAALVGFAALHLLEKTLLSVRFWFFGIYCLVLGTFLLLF